MGKSDKFFTREFFKSQRLDIYAASCVVFGLILIFMNETPFYIKMAGLAFILIAVGLLIVYLKLK